MVFQLFVQVESDKLNWNLLTFTDAQAKSGKADKHHDKGWVLPPPLAGHGASRILILTPADRVSSPP